MFNLVANIWISIAIVCALGAIGVFVGKIIELKWIDAGLPLGALIGGAVAYFLF